MFLGSFAVLYGALLVIMRRDSLGGGFPIDVITGYIYSKQLDRSEREERSSLEAKNTTVLPQKPSENDSIGIYYTSRHAVNSEWILVPSFKPSTN